MGTVVSLDRARKDAAAVKDAAAMMERAVAAEEKRYLIVVLGADGKRHLMEGHDGLSEAEVLEKITNMRAALYYVANPRIKDYFSFGYLPHERGELIRRERIRE